MDTRSSALSEITSTSAQITLSLALMCYQAQYGELELNNINQNEKEITDRLITIVSMLIDKTSSEALLNTINSTKSQLPRDQAPRANKTYLPSKANYFDDNHKVILSDAGIQQLASALRSLPARNENEVYRLNEYCGNKTAPISARRIVGVAALWSLLGSDLEYGINHTDEGQIISSSHLVYSEDMFNSACYLGFKIAFSYFLLANAQKWARQERSNDVVSLYRKAGVNALNQYNNQLTQPSTEALDRDFFVEFNKQCNILQLKGYISAQASKTRKRVTLSLAVAVSVVFIAMDIGSCGLTLPLRLGIAIGVGALAGTIRYHSKKIQNRRKIFAKNYREEITQTFQKPLIAELKVYGLQACDPNDIIASSRIGIKRQVQEDVEKLLKRRAHVFHNNILYIMKDGKNISSIPLENRELFLCALKSYAEEITPQKYQGCNKYFVMEVIFQIRTIIGDNPNLINAEREDAFCRPTLDFFARQETKGIKRFHQMIQINAAKNREKDAKNTSALEQHIPLTDDEAKAIKQKEEKLSLDLCLDIKLASDKQIHRSISRGFGTNHTEQCAIKKHLKFSVGFMCFKWRNFNITPFQAISNNFNDNMLDAYYEKIYARHERRITAKKTPSTSAFHKSGKTLFHDLIGQGKSSEEYSKKQTQYDKKRDEYNKSQAGVFESSAWTALRVTVCACIPLFNFLSVTNEVVTQLVAQAAVSTVVSSAATYAAITHARKIKEEAKLADANIKKPTLLARGFAFFNKKAVYSRIPESSASTAFPPTLGRVTPICP